MGSLLEGRMQSWPVSESGGGGEKGLLFLRGSSEYMHMGSLLSTRWLRWSRGHILAAAVDLSARFPRAGRGKCLNANTSYIFSE